MTLILDVVKFPVPFILPTAIPSGDSGGEGWGKARQAALVSVIATWKTIASELRIKCTGWFHRNSVTPVVSLTGSRLEAHKSNGDLSDCAAALAPPHSSQEIFMFLLGKHYRQNSQNIYQYTALVLRKQGICCALPVNEAILSGGVQF